MVWFSEPRNSLFIHSLLEHFSQTVRNLGRSQKLRLFTKSASHYLNANMSEHIWTQILGLTILVCFTISGIETQRQVFTPEETAALKKLRNVVGNSIEEEFMKSDEYLIRWIRTKNMDVTKATKAFQEALKWRKENRMSDILNEDMSDMLKDAPYFVDGLTKSGQPGLPHGEPCGQDSKNQVLEFYFGKWNIRKLTVAGKQAALLRHWDQMSERATRKVHQLAKNNPSVTHFVNLCDLTGYNLRQHSCLSCLPVVYDFVRHYEAYYPEYTGTFLIVNTPKIFENMLTFLKPVMSPALQKALKTYGFDKQEFSTAILDLIEPSQVGKVFGGNKVR